MDDDLTLRSVGEIGLVDRIASIVGKTAAMAGIGDDTAVIDMPGPDYLLATVDALVEGVHFHRAATDPEQLGRRAVEINASDIASMGGMPTFALVSLVLPADLSVAFVDRLYTGMTAAARSYGAEVVGGNLARTEGPIVLDLTLLGCVPRTDVVRRNGARVGDILAVTGTLGDAAAARLCRERSIASMNPAIAGWLSDRAVPTARVSEGRALAGAHLVHAMMDLSDGLATDLSHLCRAGAVGAVVDETALPISAGTRWAAGPLSTSPIDLALSGGEDYELLVALSESGLQAAIASSIALTPIGRVTPMGDGIKIRRTNGVVEDIAPTGWSHF